ncbi:tandem-95 repeat protein, partial [Candidatus Poribacteria bacterium]|nr:tandem-95 repeat protein [Candidatus Poribacteria bacterium]
ITVDVTLPANSAVALDGVGDYVDVPYSPVFDVSGDMTVEAWFNTPTALAAHPDWAGIVYRAQLGGTEANYGIIVGAGEYLRFFVEDATPTQLFVDTVGFTPTVGAWHHVAGVYDTAASELRIYVDGTLSNTVGGVTLTTAASDGGVQLGLQVDSGSTSHFQGQIDEARIWSGARTEEQIQNGLYKTLSGAEAGLVAYWNFDDGAATDLTPNANNGAFIADAATTPSAEVYDANGAPSAAAAIAATVDSGATVDVVLTGSDPDGDFLSFALVSSNSAFGVPLTLTDVDPTDGAATVSYTATGGEGADTFDFTVSDGLDESAPQTVAVTVTPAAAPNLALSLDGTGDYVNVGAGPALATSGAMTVEVWIYPTGPGSGANGMIVSNQGEFMISRYSDGTIQWGSGNNWAWVNTGYVAPLDTWTHIAKTYSSTDGVWRVYANAVEIDAVTVSGLIGDAVPADNNLFIGSRDNGTGEDFEGLIDEVRLWNVQRTPAELATNYLSALTGTEGGLIGYWTFDDAAAGDGSAPAYNGTLVGDATTVSSTLALTGGGPNADPAAGAGITSAADTGEAISITITGSDPDGTPVTFALVSANSALGVALTLTDTDPADNTAEVTYTATGGAGDDTFDFTVSDGFATSAAETVTVTVTAVGNQTATFDGSGDYVNVGADPSLEVAGEFTVEAWIYPRGAGAGGTQGGMILNKEGEYEIARFADGTIWYSVGNVTPGWGWQNTAFVAPQDAWTHLAWSYSAAAGMTYVYADGVQVHAAAVAGVVTDPDAFDQVFIGDRETIAHSFDGDIDEVRIWDVSRTAEEIANAHGKTLTSAQAATVPGLIGYWTFDDAATVTTADLSVNGNDGVLSGDASILPSPQVFVENTPPVATAGIVGEILDGGTGQIELTGSDPVDGDLLSFQLVAALSDVLAAGLSLGDEFATDNLATAGYASLGTGAATDTFSFTVSDGISTSTAQLVTVNVTEPVALTGVDLLVNGSGEDLSLAGWDIVSGTWPMEDVASPGTAKEILPQDGSYFFFSGSDALAEIRQDIDLGGYAQQIDAVNVTFSLEAYVRSWNQTPPDSTTVTLEYYTGDPAAGGSLTDTYTTGEVTNKFSWQQVTDTRTPPSGTRWARVRLIATRYGGTNNDGDFDAVRFLATGPAEVVWSQPTPAQAFDGVDDSEAAPDDLITAQGGVFSVDTWFRTLESGGIFGFQETLYPTAPSTGVPALYVDTAGLLRGAMWRTSVAAPLASATTVNDGQWHHAALVVENARHHLYLDGALEGTVDDYVEHLVWPHAQIGVGSTHGSWGGGNNDWFFYGGDVAGLNVWGGPLSDAEVGVLASTPPTVAPDNSTAVFDGSGDAIIVADAASLTLTDAVTMEAWIYPTGPGQDGVDGGAIIAKEGEYQLSRNPDGEIWYVLANTTPGWTKTVTGYFAPVNTWTHLSLTYESDFGNTALYANGVSVFTAAGVGAIGDQDAGASNELWIGARPGDPESFDGRIDEARVWSISRSGDHIASSYLKKHGGGETGLVGYWSFDGDETANDRTANANDGILAGNTLILGNALALQTNIAPVMDAVAAQAVTAGESVDITLTATDGDGDAVTFETAVEPAGGTVSIDNTTGIATYVPLLTFSGPDTFDLVANDGIDSSAPVTVAVEVTAADLDPEIAGLLELVNDDFESGVTGVWSNASTSTTPAGSRGFLGQFANTTVNLTVGSIPAHAEVTIEFDLYIMKSWDGIGSAGNDVWKIQADGSTLLQTTFSNVPLSFWSFFSGNWRQSYPGSYPGGNFPLKWGAVESNSLGFSYYGDSVYHFNFTVPHTADTLTFGFSGSGLEGSSNESWGLDNVRVTTQHVNIEEDIVSDITLPGADPGGQPVTFAITTAPTQGALTGAGPTFTYTPNLDYNGQDTFGYTVSDGGITTPVSNVVVLIDPVDDAPIFDTVADVTVDEDSGEATFTITGVGGGGASDEAAQTVSLVATSFATARVPNPVVTGTGDTRTVTFTPIPDAAGAVTAVVTATDTGENVESGGPSGGIHINTKSQQFAITVTALNDAPEFDAIADVTMDEDAAPAPITITGVGTGGGADEASQTVTFTATSDREDIVPVPTFSGS